LRLFLPPHEPGGARLGRALIPPNDRELGLDGVSPHRSWPSMRVGKPGRLSMNLLRVADPRSGARLCEAQRFMVPTPVQSWRSRLSMNLPPAPLPPPPLRH